MVTYGTGGAAGKKRPDAVFFVCGPCFIFKNKGKWHLGICIFMGWYIIGYCLKAE